MSPSKINSDQLETTTSRKWCAGLGLRHNPEEQNSGVMGDTGLEPVPILPQKTPFLKQGNAQYNALFGDDERPRLLLEAWADRTGQSSSLMNFFRPFLFALSLFAVSTIHLQILA